MPKNDVAVTVNQKSDSLATNTELDTDLRHLKKNLSHHVLNDLEDYALGAGKILIQHFFNWLQVTVDNYLSA